MKTIRAILTGIAIWILGVGVFVSSFYIPLIKDQELQANIALALSLTLLAFLGAKNYYSRYPNESGYKLGFIMVATAVILDSVFTVPFLVIPMGGNYMSFFGGASFWLVAVEYFLVVFIYWYLRVRPTSRKAYS